MRSLTTDQAKILNAPDGYAVRARVSVLDGGATWRNLDNLEGRDWIDGVEYGASLDDPLSSATVTLHREIDSLSLAPFRTDSKLNIRAGFGFDPLIREGRRFKVFAAVVPLGMSPEANAWIEVFDGLIDEVDAGAGEQITFQGRDYTGATLQDRFIKTVRPYGSASPGTPVETVMGQILADNGLGAFSIALPGGSPAWNIQPYALEKKTVLEALQDLAAMIGWELRTRYLGGAWTLCFQDPGRSKTTPDLTLSPDTYKELTACKTAISEVRNSWEVVYRDSQILDSGGNPTIRTSAAQDVPSINAYGERWAQITEAENSPINTSAEAQKLALSALADTRDVLLEQTVSTAYHFALEIGDLVNLQGNGIHYTGDQAQAVVSLSHNLADGTTEITTRGAPSLGASSWLRRETRTGLNDGFSFAKPLSPFVNLLSEFAGSISVSVIPNPLGPRPEEYELHIGTSAGFTPDASTLKASGKLSKLTVGGLDASSSYFVKVIARSPEGHTSAPTAALSTAPAAFDASVITSFPAEKITSGFLSAARLADGVITAAKFGATPPGGNLLRNGSFDAVYPSGHPDVGWPQGYSRYDNEGTGVTATVLSSGGVDGGSYLRLVWGLPMNNTKGILSHEWCQVAGKNGGLFGGWQKDRWYVASVWARSPTPALQGAGRNMGLFWNSAPNEQQTIAAPGISDTWQRYAVRFRWTGGATPETSGQVYLSYPPGMGVGGTLELDQFMIEEGDILRPFSTMVGEVLPGSITAAQVANNSLTGDQIAHETINGWHITPNNSIGGNHIGPGAILDWHVATLDAAKINSGTLPLPRLHSDVWTQGTVAGRTVPGSFVVAGDFTASTNVGIGGVLYLPPAAGLNNQGWTALRGTQFLNPTDGTKTASVSVDTAGTFSVSSDTGHVRLAPAAAGNILFPNGQIQGTTGNLSTSGTVASAQLYTTNVYTADVRAQDPGQPVRVLASTGLEVGNSWEALELAGGNGDGTARIGGVYHLELNANGQNILRHDADLSKTTLSSPYTLDIVSSNNPTFNGSAELWHDSNTVNRINSAHIVNGQITDAKLAASGLNAARFTTGTLPTAQVPNLDTSKITSGFFADLRIAQSNVTQHQAALSIAATQITGVLSTAQIPNLSASKIVSGELSPAVIPVLNADRITSGTVALNRMGIDEVNLDVAPTNGSLEKLSNINNPPDLWTTGGMGTAWDYVNFLVDNTHQESGAHCISWTTSAGIYSSNAWIESPQYVVSANGVYRPTARVNFASALTNGLYLAVYFYDRTGAYISNTGYLFNTAAGWQTIAHPVVTAPSNASYMSLRVAKGVSSSAFYLDNVRFQEYGRDLGKIALSNNSDGTNIKMGDDAFIGDCDLANGLQIKGQQNAALGYVKLGSGNALGYDGTSLVYGSENLSSSAWTSVTNYLNGWGDWDAGSPPQCKKLAGGLVVMRGLIKAPATLVNNVAITTLPVGFRPVGYGHWEFNCCTNYSSSPVAVEIDPSTGQIKITGLGGLTASSWVALHAIFFPTV